MTRQDINYILVHVIIFLAAYSGSMTTLGHGNPNFHDWFNWEALNAGLIATGGTSLGISVVGKSQAKADDEIKTMRASMSKDMDKAIEIINKTHEQAQTIIVPASEETKV